MNWQLQDAKARLSELVQCARRDGPQTVTVRGERAAVVLSAADYDRLSAPGTNFVQALLGGPAWDDETLEAVRAGGRP